MAGSCAFGAGPGLFNPSPQSVSMTSTFDLVIIGAGPAGFTAALEGVRLGMSTALVEKADLGGTCLNWGCIPTKLLLGATNGLPELAAQAKLKLLESDPGQIRFDLAALHQRKERFIAATRQAMAKQLKQADVALFTGQAVFTGPGRLKVGGEQEQELAFSRAILATGSRPAPLPGMAEDVFDGQVVLHSSHALALAEPPQSMLVVGGGAVGLELADHFSRLGTRITLVEAMDRLLPTEDPELGKAMQSLLKRRGYALHVGRKVLKLENNGGSARAELDNGEVAEAATALLAAGRLPNSRGLGLEDLGCELLGPGWVKTDERLRALAGDKPVFAVGDVNGRTLLAHAAEHQALYAVRLAAGEVGGPYDPPPMPGCVYGSVETMRVGPTAEELKARGQEVAESKSMLAANAIAQSHGASHGFVKVLWVQGRVAGITALGHGVSHLAGLASVIVGQAWRPEDAEQMIFAHPTLEEALKAALTAPE